MINLKYSEIQNSGTADLDLTGWQPSAGVACTFPADTTPRTGEALAAASDSATFALANPSFSNSLTGWMRILSRKRETIRITDNTGSKAAEVFYTTEADWTARRIGVPDSWDD